MIAQMAIARTTIPYYQDLTRRLCENVGGPIGRVNDTTGRDPDLGILSCGRSSR